LLENDADDEDKSTSGEESEAGEPAKNAVSYLYGYTGLYGILTMLCRRLLRLRRRSPSRRRFSRSSKATQSLRSRSKKMMKSLLEQRPTVSLLPALLDTIVLILVNSFPMGHSTEE
jgi:hypothetical protein